MGVMRMQRKKLIPRVFWYMYPIYSLSSKYEQTIEKPTPIFWIIKYPKMLAKTEPNPTEAIKIGLSWLPT